MLTFERTLYAQGFNWIAGVDEVGRGPLAGPVVAASVILFKDTLIEGLRDSKRLSGRARENFFPTIIEHAVCYGVGAVEPFVIDRINILNASRIAMLRALRSMGVCPDHVLVDGFPIPQLGPYQTAIVGGDDRSLSIAAASVIAKIFRDRLMERYDLLYPQYGFARNKGYPTREHLSALRQFGHCPIHRRSFAPVKEVMSRKR